MISRQEIEGKYNELVKTLTETSAQLDDIEGKNPEIKDLQGDLIEALKKLVQDVRSESQHSFKAIAWDRLVIAFFGETNAGKSTIIETFRIMFEKERKKGTDGLIVGDGRQDFTKDYHEYNMSIDGRPFTLIDVPGIEGDENEFKDIIKDALGKAHCVFYVQGHNKKPDATTAEKIKHYLGDWVNVYSIQNIRGDVSNYDEEEERETLLTEAVLKNERLIKESFESILGDVYKGNIPLQALLAMCAHASFSDKRSDLQKKQKKVISYFGSPDKVLRFSQFQTIVNLVKEKSGNFTAEIAESNKQKLISLARKARNEIEKVWNENEAETEALRSQLRNFRREANAVIISCENNIRTRTRNVANNRFNSLKQSIYNLIDRKDSDAQQIANDYVTAFPQELTSSVQDVARSEIELMKKKIEQKKKDLQGISRIGGCNFSIPTDLYLDIDVDDALDELNVNLDDIGDFAVMAATGALLGSVVPGAGNIIGAIAGGVIGLSVATFKKIKGDGGRGSAKNEAARVLGDAKSKAMPKIMQAAEKVIYNLEQNKRNIRESVDAEIRRLDEMDTETERIKQQLDVYVEKLKITEYGTI